MPEEPPKFASQSGDFWSRHRYGKIYTEQKTATSERLCVGADEEGSEVFGRLAKTLRGPYYLLYVLVVPRGGSEPGRYQSPELTQSELASMISRFGEFWDSDGRQSIWARSIPDSATVVYDRHNVIYLYGPLERFRGELDRLKYRKPESLAVPVPHQHAYRADFDALERECVAALTWHRTDLLPEDEK